MLLWGWIGPIMFMLKSVIIVTIIVTVGPGVIKSILNIIPQWVTDGLNMLVECYRYWGLHCYYTICLQEILMGSFNRICT